MSGLTSMLVIQGANIGMLAKALQQQKADGQAAVKMIEGSSIAPPRGAPEPGKGSLVDAVG